MWKILLYGIVITVIMISVIVKTKTSQKYSRYKKYKNTSSMYREKFKLGISNELVYQYINDIDGLPRLNENSEHRDVFIELYKIINEDDSISNDLKFQLKVTLSLKGIRV